MTLIRTDIFHLYLSTCIERCKPLQILWLPEDDSALQPKFVRAVKPIA